MTWALESNVQVVHSTYANIFLNIYKKIKKIVFISTFYSYDHIKVCISTFHSYAHIKVFISTFYSCPHQSIYQHILLMSTSKYLSAHSTHMPTSKYLSKGYTHITHHNNYTSVRRDRMVAGFTTTSAISAADHH
jgi:hypothetical protein